MSLCIFLPRTAAEKEGCAMELELFGSARQANFQPRLHTQTPALPFLNCTLPRSCCVGVRIGPFLCISTKSWTPCIVLEQSGCGSMLTSMPDEAS